MTLIDYSRYTAHYFRDIISPMVLQKARLSATLLEIRVDLRTRWRYQILGRK